MRNRDRKAHSAALNAYHKALARIERAETEHAKRRAVIRSRRAAKAAQQARDAAELWADWEGADAYS